LKPEIFFKLNIKDVRKINELAKDIFLISLYLLSELFRLTDNKKTKTLKITNNTDCSELVLKAKKIEDKPREEYSNLFTRLFDFRKKYIVEIAKHPNSAPAKFGLPRVNETDLFGLTHFIGSELKYCK
jgi:hypothetical protein